MIKVKISKENDIINEIIINGHANYSNSKDIVCASVSSICITTVNALIRIDDTAITYEDQNGYLKIVVNRHSKVIDILIENMIELLKELEIQYDKYIKIDK